MDVLMISAERYIILPIRPNQSVFYLTSYKNETAIVRYSCHAIFYTSDLDWQKRNG
jgi:hypothetical protein